LVAAAARTAGLNATTHSDHLRAAVDGFTGVEHNLYPPAYNDVLTLMARSGITMTNTFLFTASAISTVAPTGREPWVYPHMRRFTPPWQREQYTARWSFYSGIYARLDREQYDALFRNAARIAARGGNIAVGMHGDLPGMGFHYELWFMAEGGMPNLEILRSATIVGATAIGHAQDFGTLEPGKLADFQVLDRNPLEDIHNSTSIRYVMKNGRLYQADDLTEIWPRHKPLPTFYLFPDGPGLASGSTQPGR
jgi:imidazolonepropionase-like amidohydrolase